MTPWTAARQASLTVTISWSLLKLMSIESVMPSNHLIIGCPLLLWPSTFPSIRVFSKESVLHIRCPKYWGFSFSISPSSEYSGPISYRIDWLDFFAVQGAFKTLLQKHSSQAWSPWCSALFMAPGSDSGAPTVKSVTLFSASICHEVMGADAMILGCHRILQWTLVCYLICSTTTYYCMYLICSSVYLFIPDF